MKSYDIDFLNPEYNGIGDDYFYIFDVFLPCRKKTDRIRMIAKTLNQVKGEKLIGPITNIKLWNHNPFRVEKKKIIKLVPNPISWFELPELLTFWNRIFFESIFKYGTY